MRPSTVTCSSCIASSRPDCVFGVARLSSSTSTTLANTGPGWNSNCLRPGVPDRRAEDVRRQQVDGRLHAREAPVDRAGERARELRLADARPVLEQQVPAGQQRAQHDLERVVGDLHRLADRGAQPLPESDHVDRPDGLMRRERERRALIGAGRPERCSCISKCGRFAADLNPEADDWTTARPAARGMRRCNPAGNRGVCLVVVATGERRQNRTDCAAGRGGSCGRRGPSRRPR